MSFIFNGYVCSDLYIIKDFLQNVLNELSRIISDETVMFDVKLILNELVTNGAIHGNDYDRNKCVKLHLEVMEKVIKIEVSDEGEGFIFDCNKYNPLDLKCSGRGLIIANGLSDEFYVNKNKIIAIKYL
ncbi:ATP-binding protein [Sporanaerobacter sp. PP17-6a]|uniref:ATP-binding protein n=1 Tax=Acidilutibacter cellobiosedens TaxID=2507161 RepID=A0A410QEL5_9FIRM|nr:ATP-binding protein [Sporanaerobacter sp. PP17-6a]MBE6082624.1 ATP-binding protein [Tissierellaceae bacterium]QAT62502.1 ATP-binding protein [Acidilutibacter cellobiosedens]SCL88816.1 anti-sigma F factor [Sporanaerobacter sp. PP17-6a]